MSRALGAAARILAESEDDELGRLHWRHPHLDDQLAAVAHIGRIRFGVALDEVRLLRRQAKEHSVAPYPREERADVARHAGPEPRIVRLEDDPLRSALYRLFDVVEESSDAHVAPRRIAGEGPRTPHPHA